MKNFKILVVALLCFGCVDQNKNKTNQETDEVSLSNNTGFIKGVNHPYLSIL